MTAAPIRARVVNVLDVGTQFDVYVGRANARYGLASSKWANPFRGADSYTRDESIAAYRKYVLGRPDLLAALPELNGKVLACWCAPLPCHADVLVELADGYLP